MTQPSLFDTPPTPDCRQCHGQGFWIQYLPGRNPKDYPRHDCRECAR